MSEKWSALIQGGEGPDVWDKEFAFTAADLKDAASLAESEAETLGGHVVELIRNDWNQGHAETLTATKRKLAEAEARVKELEGLAIGNESEGDGGRWFEVFIPTERIGGANCEGEECPTLGDAIPRKEEK